MNASQPDGKNGTSDQAAAPFAQVLARKVDKSPPPASDANGDGEVANNNAAPPSPDQPAVPVDALNAILSQIPIEMRGSTVLERAAQLASGDRTAAALDPLASRMTAATLATAAPAPSPGTTKGDTAFQTELSGQSIPANPLTGADKNAAGKTSELLATSEQQLITDALRQNVSNRQELTASLVQPATSQISAAAISQAAITAMTGLSGNQPNSATPTISTPLGSPAWGEDFSQKISWMVSQKNQVAELHLNPPNLGPLDVVLKISDNQATALFTSPHAAVRDAVESAMPKLRELLADNGIMLSNATVGDQSPRDRSAEEFADRKGGASSQRGSADDASETSGTLQTLSTQRHNGMVDTFA
ncbi:MAG: hypothetical protein A2061_01435 [Gallionellales bacterium GWA2_59_43]|nr:MAG: hypothetical protein A2061_01435 [Gallionellales bacterium GWA2_59_43]